jgi:hypothetical protein
MADETLNTTLSVGDAADFLGVSVQTLRRWDSSGKLKSARHPASKYRYYALADLEPFRTQLFALPEHNAEIGRLFQAAPVTRGCTLPRATMPPFFRFPWVAAKLALSRRFPSV